MRRFVYVWMIFLFALACALGGCTAVKAPDGATGEGYSVVDFTGTELRLAKKPERIVSLTISTDEILLDLVPHDRIVGLSYLVDDPGISNAVEKSGDVSARLRGNHAEAILNLRPDLVIAADFFQPEMIKTLREMGIPVYVYKTQKNMQEVRDVINELATVVGEPQNAAPLLRMMDEKLDQIRQKVWRIPANERKRVIYVQTIGATFRPESSFHDICRLAGGREAALELNLQKNTVLSKEEIVRLNPDVFVLSAWNYDGKHNAEQKRKEILEDPAYRSVAAVENRRVAALPVAHMQALSHHIVYAVEDMAKALYPEKFE